MKGKIRSGFSLIAIVTITLVMGCGGESGSEGDASEDDGGTTDTVVDSMDVLEDDPLPETVEDVVEETALDVIEDTVVEDVIEDPGEEEGTTGPDELGTNNQDITGVERVIFLGDSITASPYIVSPWSDRIQDRLRTLYGSDLEIRNYAVWGARTEHVLDEQILNIDTSSTKKTLVMFTIGGNDALQVIGSDVETALAHMEGKVDNIRQVLDFLYDPANVPGGVYVVFANVYDPTDGVGDFTHCGFGAGLEDWPEVDEIANDANVWYLDLANTYGADMLDLHHLFAGHGWNHDNTASPYYCSGCSPDCPCPRWYDITCIHPNTDGHEALAGFFYAIITR